MAQITWRNVNGPDSGSELAAINQAGQNISRGFDKFAELGTSIQQKGIIEDNKLKAANTEKALSAINSIGSAEQYQRATESGMFSQEGVAKQFGAVDDKAIRLAFNDRQSQIRNDTKAKTEFDDYELSQSEKVDKARINTLIAKGDPSAQQAIDDSNIQDKSELTNTLKSSLASTEKQRRVDAEYARNQDSISDSDKITMSVNKMTSTRSSNIEASNKLNEEFTNLMKQIGVPNDTFYLDASGNLRFSDGVPIDVQENIKGEYSLVKANLPTILSDKEQIANLRETGKELNADPRQVEASVASLKNIQNERLSLSPASLEQVDYATAQADRQYNQIVEAEGAALAEAQRSNPVNFKETAQKEGIKPSEGILRATKFVKDELYDGDADDSDVNKFSRLLSDNIDKGYKDSLGNTTTYPGWVIEEAAKRAEAKIGSNSVGYFGVETNVNKVMDEVSKVMQQHLSDKSNQKILNALATDSKARLFAAEGARQNLIKNAITNAKSQSGVYDISRNSSRAVQDAMRRNQQ
jgi:hypothetical protein